MQKQTYPKPQASNDFEGVVWGHSLLEHPTRDSKGIKKHMENPIGQDKISHKITSVLFGI